jgi:hypothetical protein
MRLNILMVITGYQLLRVLENGDRRSYIVILVEVEVEEKKISPFEKLFH